MNRYDNVKVEIDGDEVLIRCKVGDEVQLGQTKLKIQSISPAGDRVVLAP